MNKAELISLIAAIGTLLGLIPAYHQFLQSKEKKKQKKILSAPTNSTDQNIDQKPPEQMSAFYKALCCVAMAAVLLVIELFVFSWLAFYFGVKVDINTMPFNWKVGFFALLLIPSILLLIALVHFSSVFED